MTESRILKRSQDASLGENPLLKDLMGVLYIMRHLGKQWTPCREHRWAGRELMLRSDVLTRYKMWANCWDMM